MVSSLPWRADSLHQVSLIENYPAPLTALGEPVRQVLVLLCAASSLKPSTYSLGLGN